MPGYGIQESKSGLLKWKWATDRLAAGLTYWLATARPDGRPHVMPVWGIWMDSAFYFSTGDQSRKARNLVADARCSVTTEIDPPRRPKKGQIKDALIIEGTAEKLTDQRLIRKFAKLYGAKYAWDMEGFKEPVYRVRPKTVFGFTTEFTESATRWTFD
jgi:nitroimidazol reductase NimA-like FMN-containing flavoprotein (pyridoxamine 5'-phosphate oxidase superfamily)